MDNTDGFRAQLIALASLSTILCLPTVALNFRVFTTIVRKKHLHQPTYINIASIALTDWLVGCVSFPCITAICIMQSMDKNPCIVAVVSVPTSSALSITTFLVNSFQAVERYIAVFNPYQFKVRFTNSVVVAMNVTIWLFSFGAVLFWMLTGKFIVFSIFIGATLVMFSVVDVFCYFRIYRETKKVERQIAVQVKVSSEDETTLLKAESRVARVTAMILINVFFCYTPMCGCMIYRSLVDYEPIKAKYFSYWAALNVYLNSFTTPLISCLQLSVIRRAAFSRKAKPCENADIQLQPQ